MGRPKRKLSPLKSDTKLRKLSAFGFGSITGNSGQNKENSDENTANLSDSLNKSTELVQPGEDANHSVSQSNASRQKAAVKRYFRSEWQHNRDWLLYDAVKKVMFCTICKKAQLVNSFTSGCSTLKLENVQAHENPKGKKIGDQSHIRALEIVRAVKETESARARQLQASEAAVIGALKNVVFLANHDLPMSMMTDLNDLCKEQGAAHLNALSVDKHTTYEHNTSINEFQEAIAEVIEEDLILELRKSDYFSVMLDESTDISVDQNLIIYVRYLVQESGRYESRTYFFGLVKLSEGATAVKIYESLISVFENKGIDMSKLCGVATDGAAVMLGSKSGVVTKLKNDFPGILSMHCIAHRLALGSGNAADSIPYLLKFQEIVNALYKYFDNSPKNMNNLKAMQNILDMKRKLKLKQIFHTRWLSFDRALKAIITNYACLLSVFLADKSPKAVGLLKSISCYKFLYTAHFLADVMQSLSNLSKSFQAQDIDFAGIYPLLEHTVDKITSLKANLNGDSISEYLRDVPQDLQADFEYKGHIIRCSEKQVTDSASVCQSFCEKVIKNLKSRFDNTGDSKILSSLGTVFDPSIISRVHEHKELMNEHLDIISSYASEIGADKFKSQALELIQFLNCNPNVMKLMNSVGDTCQYIMKNKVLYPDVANLAFRFSTAPVSSVECERGFSRHNLIKTKTRNCLGTGTVENLMRISLEKPSFQFDYQRAFQKWVSKKSRRIM